MNDRNPRLLCGVDVGGTFTDCCLIDQDGKVVTGKASTTSEIEQGFFEAMAGAADQLDLELDEALRQLEGFVHGSTVATNALVERTGARVGLITTVGFGDSLFIQRGYGKAAGLPPSLITHLSVMRKPEPLVPRSLVEEIVERVDWKGAVVVELDEEGARAAVRRLVDAGVEAIAVSLLWSFRNPAHERRVKEIALGEAPGVFVTISSDVAPKWGEYERTVATVINAYVGPQAARYVSGLAGEVARRGVGVPLLLLQAAGGVMSVETAVETPVAMLDSGPVGGAIGAALVAPESGWRDAIVTDMGGTSFDVGVIVDGLPLMTESTIVEQYEFFQPKVDIKSIGAGGGSIVWLDQRSRTIKVGPASAGADPGPVAYGRGGTEPTITDANVVLSRFHPDRFLGGRLRLDYDAARAAYERLGTSLGMSAEEAAAAAVTICELQMAELIRQATVEKGYDPRDFVVLAIGGAGPAHAGGFSAALGARAVIVPLTNVSAAWSAYGAARADLVHRFEVVEVADAPFDPVAVAAAFDELTKRGVDQLTEDGTGPDAMRFRRLADLRYKAQINEVEVDFPEGPVDEALLQRLIERFEAKYERLYGEGTGFAGAGIELVALRVEARGLRRTARVLEAPVGDGEAYREDRDVFWYRHGRVRTAIYEGLRLGVDRPVEGPAIVEMPHTTVVVHPQQRLRLDRSGSFVIELNGTGGEA